MRQHQEFGFRIDDTAADIRVIIGVADLHPQARPVDDDEQARAHDPPVVAHRIGQHLARGAKPCDALGPGLKIFAPHGDGIERPDRLIRLAGGFERVVMLRSQDLQRHEAAGEIARFEVHGRAFRGDLFPLDIGGNMAGNDSPGEGTWRAKKPVTD